MGEKGENSNNIDNAPNLGYAMPGLNSGNSSEPSTITCDVNMGNNTHQPQIKQLKSVKTDQERVVEDGALPNKGSSENLNEQASSSRTYNDTLLIGAFAVLLALVISRK